MGFLVGLVVNVALLSVPIGSTLGTLFKIRPFENERKPEEKPHNTLITNSSCSEFHEFALNKIGLNYTLNSNQILNESDSTLCMNMTTFENATYPTNSTAPEFSFTWQYPFRNANESAPANQTKPLIHAFPQASISGVVPLTLEDLGGLTLDFAWTMGIGNTNAPSTSVRRLGAQLVNASVALDMYMDPDESKAGDAGKAAFEMIIYFAHYGLQDPVGFGNGTIVTTEKLGGTDFRLFAGKNANDQNVFSWVATEPITEFHSDISPLFNSILALNDVENLKADTPTFTDFLGYVGFGTQAYNSVGNVTFWVPRLSMDVRKFGV
ncbi:hypothetical protein GP486_001862 [Trichoglossum hirsutum]|uniref:Glycoside hydrolase family 12 protein n=1 Tax=Trichoglossum hirsutum TaxID=265104 RepID=A0A9P8RSP3_9PEZI|nr:hypothetical protein GP486_001862 [Trichoglossum hirsutum]